MDDMGSVHVEATGHGGKVGGPRGPRVFDHDMDEKVGAKRLHRPRQGREGEKVGGVRPRDPQVAARRAGGSKLFAGGASGNQKEGPRRGVAEEAPEGLTIVTKEIPHVVDEAYVSNVTGPDTVGPNAVHGPKETVIPLGEPRGREAIAATRFLEDLIQGDTHGAHAVEEGEEDNLSARRRDAPR